MLKIVDGKKKQTKCENCPLRALEIFRDFNDSELNFVSGFKKGELSADKGAAILVEGSHSAHLFTVLSGWGFRYKVMEDGRRQILNYIMPGDLVGLQGTITGEMEHSVEALTDMTLCVFERDRIIELIKNHPELGYDLTWIAAREERILDEHLLSVGRRTALERAAYLLSYLHIRITSIDGTPSEPLTLPITQQHLADTLGLSIVHTNKTLKKLAERKLIKWLERGCEIIDESELAILASWEPTYEKPRPFL